MGEELNKMILNRESETNTSNNVKSNPFYSNVPVVINVESQEVHTVQL